MAAQDLQQREDIEDDLAEVKAYLAERGVFPNSEGMFSKREIPAIEAAVREREWNPTLKSKGDEWVIIVEDQRHDVPAPEEAWIDADPVKALLNTLDVARRLMTRAEAAADLDREARRLTGMSGEEFQRKWDAGELDYGDPHVIHVGMSVPRGR